MNLVYHRFWYRVGIVVALSLIPSAGLVAVRAQTQPDMRVTLLGTGTPTPIIDRFGPSTLIEQGPKSSFSIVAAAVPFAYSRKRCASAR